MRFGLALGERPAATGGVAFGAFLVVATGLTDGGYVGTSWTAVTIALAAAATLTASLVPFRRPSGSAVLAMVAAAALVGWIALSERWAPGEADTWLEARRALLYAVAVAAVVVVASGIGPQPVLVGVTSGVAVVAAVALGLRIEQGLSTDGPVGELLAEPVGYPNALGIVAAIGAILAVGLAVDPACRLAGRRALTAIAPVLVLVLGLTESRGSVLVLVAGWAALVALAPGSARLAAAAAAAAAAVVGAAGWVVVDRIGLDGVGLATVAVAVAALGAAFRPPPPRVRRGALGATLAVVVVVLTCLVLLQPEYASSSFRSAYWRAALEEVPQSPFQGSGAGTFFLTWLERRTVETDVRDAHSLYVETLSELGLVGLLLVAVVIGAPLAAAWRSRGTLLGATAGAAFVAFALHAGLDWDWEMPVATLTGLGCAGVLLARPAKPAAAADGVVVERPETP